MESYEEFKRIIREQAIYVSDLSRFDNYLYHVKNEKLILKDLKNEIIDLKKMISHFNWQSIFNLKFIKDGNLSLCKVNYNDKINIIIKKLEEILDNIDNDDIKEKANRIVYGAEYIMNFYISLDIETDNFNRIHVIDDLPYSMRDLGLGKILYKNTIKKFHWLSSEPDTTNDSRFVWDSLSKDEELYTCLKDKSIICFDAKLDKNIIENVLRKWLKGAVDYVIDSDMKKYPDFDIS